MSPDEADVVEQEPRESRTAQFYQARDDSAHPLKPKYTAEAKRSKYDMALAHRMDAHPYSNQPRLKIVFGGPSHTRLSQVAPRRTNVADTQEE